MKVCLLNHEAHLLIYELKGSSGIYLFLFCLHLENGEHHIVYFIFYDPCSTVIMSMYIFLFCFMPSLVLENEECQLLHSDVMFASLMCICYSLSLIGSEMELTWLSLF